MLLCASRAQRSPGFKPLEQQKRAGLRYAFQQSVPAKTVASILCCSLIVEFPEQRRIFGGFELGENVFQKVHMVTKSPPCLSKKRRDEGGAPVGGTLTCPAEQRSA